MTKVLRPNTPFHEVKSHFSWVWKADPVARICLRKSRFIDANNLRVGTLRSASFFSFSVGVLTMTLPDVVELFGTDEKCRELLERLRWPSDPECPRCHATFSHDGMRGSCTAKNATTNLPSLRVRFSYSDLPLQNGLWPFCCSAKHAKVCLGIQLKRTLGVSYENRMVSLPSHSCSYERN